MTRVLLAPHPGPTSAPAAASGTGLRSRECLRFEFDARESSMTRVPFPDFWEDRPIAPVDEFVWAVFPAFDEHAEVVLDGFRAALVAIDLEFDDGRRLLASVPREVDRTSSAASARSDLDFPDQWNERRLSLSAFAGARIVSAELVVETGVPTGSTSETLEGWIDAARIVPAATEPTGGAAERVVTTRGTHSSPWRSRGNTQPLTGVPHGHAYVAPATDLSNPHWTYSWNAHAAGPHPTLAGLLITRSPSIWIGDRGALAMRVGLTPDDTTGVAAEEFDHDNETALPHRYSVTTLSGMVVDTAATSAGVAAEFTFPSPGRIVLCAPGAPLTHAEHEVTPDGIVSMRVASTLPSPHEPDPMRGFYSLTISGVECEVREMGSVVIIDVLSSGTVRADVGSSLISTTQAEHARLSVGDHSIDDIAAAARSEWETVLGLVEAPSASIDDRSVLASDLYRLFLYPSSHHEQTPSGPQFASPTERDGDDTPQSTGRRTLSGKLLTDNGFWDTYRTAWPAHNLLAPGRAGELLDGMLEHVRIQGWSPRWTAGTPLDAMVGTSLDIIAADAVASGILGVDTETAYSAALRNATAASSDPRFGRTGMPHTLALGYTSDSIAESVSWTIEGAINDAGAAVLARELARASHGDRAARLHADSRYLAHRALAYRSLWDSHTRFFRPRTSNGEWADEPFDPRVWGGAHTETNAWGSRFPAPHDGHALAELFGGPSALGDALDDYFLEQESARIDVAGSYGNVIHEMPEARDIRRGMWAVSNQPAHHVPWMFAFTDRPWRTNEILHDAVHRLFRGSRIGQGLPGDEDNGEMSAWHVFAQIGFAPFQPGSGRLLVTAPTHDRLTLRPLGAAKLDIVTRRRNTADRHIHSIHFNGKEWIEPTVGLATLHEGGVWDVELGPDPVQWSAPLDPQPFFAPDGVHGTELTDIATTVTVDTVQLPRRGGSELLVRSGSVIEFSLANRRAAEDPALVVLGLAHAGTHSFSFEAHIDGLWHQITNVTTHEWEWDAQARPFEIALPNRADSLRVRWEGSDAAVTLAQVLE